MYEKDERKYWILFIKNFLPWEIRQLQMVMHERMKDTLYLHYKLALLWNVAGPKSN